MSYDAWKCSPPVEPGPEPLAPSYHDDCEQQLEERDDEIARLHTHITELETELEALRAPPGRMTYGELFTAVADRLPAGVDFSIGVQSYRFSHRVEPLTEWRVWWRRPSAPEADHGKQVTAATAEDVLDALKKAEPVARSVSATDPTGVDALVRDADVGF